MDAIDAIKARCSVRQFKDTILQKAMLEKIVDCGRLAPTARKEEPWEFITVTGRETLKAMGEITDHGKFIQSAAAAIVVCCKDTKYYLEDGCAATENMLIAASSLGIASCWVAGDKKTYCREIMELLKVPHGYKLVSIIALGHSFERVSPLDKRPLKNVLHWERF